jgi:general secretion pathway protein H
LIEIVIVLAIIAAAAALVLPNLPRLAPTWTLDAATEEAAAVLRQARGMAIRSSRAVEVVVGAGTIGVAGLGGRGLPVEPRRPIAFFADGSSSGGRVVLAAGGRQRAINVDPLTGRVVP